jgi:DNA repair protein RadA/Sms
VGRCPECGTWGTVNEVALSAVGGSASRRAVAPASPAVPISSIDPGATRHFHTGISELDRVLGGGVVPGSVTLLAGDPGVGKSTLLLEVAHRWASTGRRALYLSGEESAGQIRLRAERTGCTHDEVYLAAESDLQTALGHIDVVQPSLVVVDSVQTMSTTEADGVTGGVTQVRAVTTALTMTAKTTGVAMLLVGHVTKDGAIAGPKVLEHMVDTVLYFEGDSGHAYRVIRGIKNRFGPTHEIGVFEMRDNGLAEVANPSAFFLAERPDGAAGSVVVPSMEGTRPILIEIQALVSATSFGMPRRTAIGVDHNRVSLLTAVLDKIGGIHLGNCDIFLNVAGGVKVEEPAIDLGIVSALASSFLNRPIAAGTVVFGEVGLTGEIRGISQMEIRIREAARMGFVRCILPRTLSRDILPETGMALIRIVSLRELTEYLF